MGFKNLQNRHTFNMPDGSILHSCRDVDRYYNLQHSATSRRLLRGWTEKECANNKREGGYNKYIFNMPDGSVLTSCSDVDRWYGLRVGVTFKRLRLGWTLEECANNECANDKRKREHRKYTFNMPDGSILNNCSNVDRWYGLRVGVTRCRIRQGWTEEECANNKRGSIKYTFNMPDGSVLYSCSSVDRYYNLGSNVTINRLNKLGWTLEECANNKKKNGYRKYTFNMPHGSVLYNCRDVDRYYNLRVSTTRGRIRQGWTEEECANNRRFKK